MPRPAAFALVLLLQAGRLLSASVSGIVKDAESGDPVPFAQIQITELSLGAVAHDDGSFHLVRLPAGELSLSVSRIGYRMEERVVLFEADTDTTLEFRLHPEQLMLGEVTTNARRGTITDGASLVISGRQLQDQLGQSVAETMNKTAGVSVRSMGPAPARPVVRGQNGARLTLLEDGNATGDLSASSSDHAVAIDPLLVEEIDIIRGPAAYHYAASVLGGVVNVKHNSQADVEPHRVSGKLITQASSAAQGIGSAAAVSLPLRKVFLHADYALRNTRDLRTPSSLLKNTKSRLSSGSIGSNYVDKWGNAGFTLSSFNTEYGLPGGFLGAHPNGVSVDLKRDVLTLDGAWHVRSNVLSDLLAGYSFTRVLQREYESSGALGVEFGLLYDQANLEARFKPLGPLNDIRVSSHAALRDYETAAFSFTPDSRQADLAIAASVAMQTSGWKWSVALRTDFAAVVPGHPDTSRIIGVISRRDFSGISGALRVARDVSTRCTIGTQLSRSFRAPQIEELFSEGPHLAAYSYEIGNPRLPAEEGWTTELDAAYLSSRWDARGSVYAGFYDTYIFPEPTGRPSPVRNDLELYQYLAGQAMTFGCECDASWHISSDGKLGAQASYVRSLLNSGENLPAIPPMNCDLEFTQELVDWIVTPSAHAALHQSQIGEFEQPTAGYLRCDLRVSRHWTVRHALIVATAKIENLFDTPYRNHLSRVKSIAPEAGRDAYATLSLQF